MSSYDHNFGTLPAADIHAAGVDQYWNQNVNLNVAVHQNNPEKEQSTSPQERNTSAFAELFEDLHRYIQQEQNCSSLINESEISRNIIPTPQNEYYQYNTFKPVENTNQFPPSIPVQISYPQILSYHSGVVHRAHISLVPTTSGSLKTITKRKRKRTIFTTEQVEELEKYFSQKPYVTREDRQVLVQRLNINDKAVKIWFQNRRLKGKRDQCQSPLSDNVTMETNSPEFRLDYIESQINEKTDKFGYVTLDDTMMDNLVHIIDNYLGNCNFNSPVEETSAQCENSPIYEPISPPDSTKEEDDSHWQSSQLRESLQTILDLQSTS